MSPTQGTGEHKTLDVFKTRRLRMERLDESHLQGYHYIWSNPSATRWRCVESSASTPLLFLNCHVCPVTYMYAWTCTRTLCMFCIYTLSPFSLGLQVCGARAYTCV
ncbi:GNAT family acetyltransferase [Histoplasma ohiense]|nr:GNAT family acetyltransferase [Histoplasma ohiense (nom. inval.)]